MLRSILILLLALWGATAHADEKEDAAFYVTHFLPSFLAGTDAFPRPTGFFPWDRYYKDLFASRHIQILDRKRFNSMFPQSAIDDAFQQLRGYTSEAVVEFYGPENLAQIADFFQSPTGQLIFERIRLGREKTEELLRNPNSSSGTVRRLWTNPGTGTRLEHLLKFSELSRYNAFANTPAGQIFVEQENVLRMTLRRDKRRLSLWYTPPLDQPFMIDIIEADGVLRFPNRIARAALIKEIKAASS
ncbi:MAG: hypothetical protein ABJM43_19260 [Paracoccaceae bacterium]